MRKCKICGKKKDVTLFRTRSNERQKHLWQKACNMELKHNSYICSEHFLPSDLIYGSKLSLMPSAVPSVGIVSKKDASLTKAIQNWDNCLNFVSCNDLHDDNFDNVEYQEDQFDMVDESEEFLMEQVSCGTQTDIEVIISNSEIENYQLRAEIRRLKAQIGKLEKNLKKANNIINRIT